MKPCTAPQCGGFTLEAELGSANNSSGEVLAHGHHLGWEVKQFAVEDFERVESAKPITMMTPEPDGGNAFDTSPEALTPSPSPIRWARVASDSPRSRRGGRRNADGKSFIRKFGYADKNDKPDRLNFGGRIQRKGAKRQRRRVAAAGKTNDAAKAASFSFRLPCAFAPLRLCVRKIEPNWQYAYGHKVRLAQGTDSLRLLRAFAAGAMYYDPGIKLECLRTATSIHRESEVKEAQPVSLGVPEHHRALRDGGDGGGVRNGTDGRARHSVRAVWVVRGAARRGLTRPTFAVSVFFCGKLNQRPSASICG